VSPNRLVVAPSAKDACHSAGALRMRREHRLLLWRAPPTPPAGRTGPIYALLAAMLVAALAVGGLIVFGRGSPTSPTLKIFVSAYASQEQLFAIHNSLLSTPGLSNCVWWSNHRDYIEAMSFQDNDSIQFPLRMKSTPPSFRCHVSSSPDLASALRRFRAQPGVLSVFSSP